MIIKNRAAVAIFVPHEGCPGQCAFCNQRFVSGTGKPPTPEQAGELLKNAAKTLQGPAQIAFFGGSFTAIDREYMTGLLETAQEYLDGQAFTGIRISTRPDAIDKEVLDILKYYRVTDIELGVQSMSDDVLQANSRGHGAEDSVRAAGLIKDYGFGLGLQMMTGLYKDNDETAMETARRIIGMRPDGVRVYPTTVLRGTLLERLFERGEYSPQTLDEAVTLGADLLSLFTDNGIPVIRMGLHDSPELTGNMVAGPHHPAFRELCESRVLIKRAMDKINENRIGTGKITLLVQPSGISKMTGQKRENLIKLENMGYQAKVVPDGGMDYLQVEVMRRM